MCKWSSMWKLSFKESKCVHLRCRCKDGRFDSAYSLNGVNLATHNTYKDLGIIISSDLSFNEHYRYITARTFRVLGLLRRTFSKSMNIREKKLLYISLVRSQLLYCSVLWRPHLVKDIEILERVQRHATKYILNDFTSDYKSRLLALNMLPLMYVFDLQDILFAVSNFKSVNEDFDLLSFVQFSKRGTRSSTGLKLSHVYAPINRSRHFFFNRIPRLWNSLPPFNLELSIATIKHNLVNLLWNHFRDNFLSSSTCSYHYLCPCSRCYQLFHSPTF